MNQGAFLKVAAAVSAFSGIVILAGVLFPIASYENAARQYYPELLSPIGQERKDGSEGSVDYTKASNWFPKAMKPQDFKSSGVSFYTISIAKLKIEGATVAIGGEDLSKSLIQYPQTALPGKRGNSVIFGHSILPIFYNPKDYISIFSILPTLKEGDEILVNYDGVSYKYEVETKFEVLPQELQVLEQDVSDSFLTLVTCVPPGDPRKPRRLIVRARIVPIDTGNANTRS